MRKLLPIILLTLGVVLLFFFTNPETIAHQTKVKEYVHQNLGDKKVIDALTGSDKYEALGSAMGFSLGQSIVDRLIEGVISRDDYYLFSFTKLHWQGEDRKLGIGILGKVFLFNSDQLSGIKPPEQANLEKEYSDSLAIIAREDSLAAVEKVRSDSLAAIQKKK
jgi:hypothetical protein